MPMRWRLVSWWVALAGALPAAGGNVSVPVPVERADEAAARRGEAALLGRCFSAPLVTRAAYDRLWKQWGLKERPADFDDQVRQRYGLHEAPYPNDGLPMGLRPARGRVDSVGIDCMLCHAGSIFGRPVMGLPNTSIELHGLFQDLDISNGGFGFFPYRFSNVRGTTESTATGIFLLAKRDPDLSFRFPGANLGPVPDQLCEDAPAWWLLKRKETMYHNGQIDARAVRPLMTFMLSPGATRHTFEREEPTFADIRQYIGSLEPPAYPLPVDASLARHGEGLFEKNCARCHGTYGADAEYPNKIVPLEKIGTDPSLVRRLTPEIEDHFRRSWFTKELGPDGEPYPLRYNAGYQAPPLDGVWATAPYLHNGSVPTLHHLLKSSDRPKVFTRSYATAVEDYDAERVGWRVTELPGPAARRSGREARQVDDTSKRGRSNAGHTFGDALSDEERRAVIEYLKTL
jgi:mono/diheme cytochrome c family protein